MPATKHALPLVSAAFLLLAACSSAPNLGDLADEDPSTDDPSSSSPSAPTERKVRDAGVDAAADAHADAHADASSPTCSNVSLLRPTSDNGYRVQEWPNAGTTSAGTALPAPTKSWTMTYKFIVPPVPCSSTWNPENQTFYIWGDQVFDQYGLGQPFQVSTYKYNQIVPQLMVGNVLTEAGPGYTTGGTFYTSWVIQAQYFWENENNQPFLQTGPVVAVNPGDSITTTIAYSATTGAITASIAATEGTSTITIKAPFPNESPLLFSSWKTFFQAASAKSNGLFGWPQLNVESHFVDQATLCGLLPWRITDSVIPNVPASSSDYDSGQSGTFNCGSTPNQSWGF